MLTTAKQKIMIVDDSVVVRGSLRQIIEKEHDLEVVTTAINGKIALQQYQNYKPDVTIMDIEMPEMDGIECLTEILKINPQARIIMCSSLTQKGTALAMKALSLGAFECLSKPTTTHIDSSDEFKTNLVRLLKNIKESPIQQPIINNAAEIRKDFKPSIFELRPYPTSFIAQIPKVLAIGSSTGGPNALIEIISNIRKDLNIPVFITQHMPKGFTKLLADNLSKKSNHSVIEAKNEMRVKKGQIYLAAGGMHMTVEKTTTGMTIFLKDDPPVNFCKPAVDVMMDSIVKAYQTNIIGLILTGMGDDGLRSCQRMIEHNDKNILIAQDEITSIVWGMPGAVAMAGLCHHVIPMSNIASSLNKLLNGQRP